MRHGKVNYHFNRDANSRKALFLNLSKSLIEKEQIKTTLERAKALRSVIEKLVTKAKIDTLANRRLLNAELHNDNESVKKLFAVLGPRYKDRKGGYTRVLKAGIRYGDAASMGIIEFVDRDVNAKKSVVKKEDAKKTDAVKAEVKKTEKLETVKIAKATKTVKASTKEVKEVAVKRRATGK